MTNIRKFINEFKEFALRGNVIDLAVGVIIGTAFQRIVNSLVNDIISPAIGMFTKTDFSDKVLNIGNVSIRYGSFITAVINFLIMAFIIFIFIKAMNKLSFVHNKNEELENKSNSKECPFCYTEINIKATRCPNCTSNLDTDKDKDPPT